MRITSQLIRSRCRNTSQQMTEYLNLSHLDISLIEKLGSCKRLKTLILSYNHIESVPENIQPCAQLWHLDLCNNKVRNLDGFSLFIAIGTLNLANNQLTWSELAKIQHLHILDLCLHGNPELEKDAYYRIHAIDCLPNIWMLDGRLVTSAERIQVKTFFDESASSDRPVRHKIPTKTFVPSEQKNREIKGVHGEMTSDLMRRFPVHGAVNVDTDIRRLKYLSQNIVQDMLLEASCSQRDYPVLEFNEKFLVEILEVRDRDLQRGNMLLLLLMASLEFSLPESLFKDTLEVALLDRVGRVYAMSLFLLPQKKRTLIASVLLSSVKVERVEKRTGGLYDRLYLCMNYLVSEAVKVSNGDRPPSSSNSVYRKYRCLLAAEVVLLMCCIPSFVHFMQKDPGVQLLITSATGDDKTLQASLRIAEDLLDKKAVGSTIDEAVRNCIQAAVIQHLASSRGSAVSTMKPEDKVFSKRPLPKRPMSGPIFSSTYHTRGRSSPDLKPTRVTSAKPARTRLPDIGDLVLIGTQHSARIVSLPQPDIALVLLSQIPEQNIAKGSRRKEDERYAYIDTRELKWDTPKGFWKTKEDESNRLTLHYIAEDAVCLEMKNCGLTTPNNIIGVQGRSCQPDVVVHPRIYNEGKKTSVSISSSSTDHLCSSVLNTPTTHITVKENTVATSPFIPPGQTTSLDSRNDYKLASMLLEQSPAADVEVRKGSSSEQHSGSGAENDEVHSAAENHQEYHSQPDDADHNRQPGQADRKEQSREQNPSAHAGLHDYSEHPDHLQQDDHPVAQEQRENAEHNDIQIKQNNLEVMEDNSADEPLDDHSSLYLLEEDKNNNAIYTESEVPSGIIKSSVTPSSCTISPMASNRQSAARPRSAHPGSAAPHPGKGKENHSIQDETQNEEKETCFNQYDRFEVELNLNTEIAERSIAPTNSPEPESLPSSSIEHTPSTRIQQLEVMIHLSPQTRKITSTQAKSRPTSGISFNSVVSETGGHDEVFTPYLRERAEAWSQKIHGNEVSSFGARVRWGNLWLAGGRDLHRETLLNRPKSSAVPGWKEGLKGSAPFKMRSQLRAQDLNTSKNHATTRELSYQPSMPNLANGRRVILSGNSPRRVYYLHTREQRKFIQQLTDKQRARELLSQTLP